MKEYFIEIMPNSEMFKNQIPPFIERNNWKNNSNIN